VTEEERIPLARLEIAGLGWSGGKAPASEFAARQSGLAHEARELATEAEALAAKAGGAGPFAGVVGMLRSAAEAMDRAAGSLGGMFASRPKAEAAAVLAFVRLSRAPNRFQELMMRLGGLLAAQMERLLDTWRSDPASRGPEPTEDDLKSAAESAKATGGEAAPAPGLEAKLGRVVPGEIERRAGGRAGTGRTGGEAARLQSEIIPLAREAGADLRKLASEGRPGEMNPAAPMIEAAAKDVDAAVARMEEAGAALPRSFVEAEPPQARAVASLVRALSRLASGASSQTGEREEKQLQRGKPEEGERGEERDESGERPEEAGAEGRDEEKREKKEPKDVTKEQAARLLEEAAQEEREVRRDIRMRRGTGAAEVERDW
jgi:hypothetical protein